MEEIRGLKFPFSLDPNTGGWPMEEGISKYRQNIVQILLTQRGERPMFQEFGAKIRRYVWEMNDAATQALLKYEITEAIHRFEPRVVIQDVLPEVDRERGLLTLRLKYYIDPTQMTDQLSLEVPVNG